MRPLPMLHRAPNALVVYHGPSRLNGAPIVAVITGLRKPSSNSKTGPLAQLWILDAGDDEPHHAQQTGADASVCGSCPFRPSDQATEKRCYVKTFQAPLAVWRKWRAGGYGDAPWLRGLEDASKALLTSPDRGLRLGAYGDPAALPSFVVEALTAACAAAGKRWTGYTHQWRDHAWTARYTMASCETRADEREAQALGFRTFTAYASDTSASELDSIPCPHTTRGVSCADCRLCDGATDGDRRASINIAQHI